MLQDRYGNGLSTGSVAARDAYIEGVDRFLAADVGVDAMLGRAVTEDPGFALAHLGIARSRQIMGDGRGARAALQQARDAATGLTNFETGQMDTLGALIEGRAGEGYQLARAQLADHPRDALVAGACLGVFGLIGFSGLPGREAENLALAEVLAPSYGEDWWFLCMLAFAQMETGQHGPAERTIDRSLALNARNANGSHYRAHLYYEVGETAAGYGYLTDWMVDYPKEALMHCHNSWHIALWAMAQGDVDTMWRVIDADVDPRGALGPPLNVLTDMAAILYRAELAGVEVPGERWLVISDYAAKLFAKPGLAFADVHAALAHAMAGRSEALQRIISDATGTAGDMVRLLAEAFGALAVQDWPVAVAHLTRAMGDHQRIGGSRAQRDLLEYALAGALMRMGRSEEARRLLVMHRPHTATAGMVAGLDT